MEIMETNYTEDLSYKAAKKRVKDIKSFYIHLFVYLFINLAIIAVNTDLKFLFYSGIEISNFFTAFFWGIGLAAHWASVFGPATLLGRDWEEKKIKELMEKERKQLQKWE